MFELLELTFLVKHFLEVLSESKVIVVVTTHAIELIPKHIEEHTAFTALSVSHRTDVEKNGITITEDGKSRINPAVSIMTKEQNIILAMLKDYGISARSRKKLLRNDSDENPDSPLSQFLDMVNNE